jgi:DNA-binding transcriptional LysR family regulator
VETVIALPAILHAYYSKYPDVELSLKAGVTESLVQEVAEMRLDGAFVTGPVKHPLIEQFDVFQEKLVLVSQGNDFSVDDFTTRPLLVYKKGCGYRGRLETWLKMEGIIPKRIMEFGTFETIIGSVAAGIGMTVFPESSISGLVAQGLVCGHAIPEPYNEVTTVFIRRKEAFVTSTLQSFIDEITTQTEA